MAFQLQECHSTNNNYPLILSVTFFSYQQQQRQQEE
jgi:hypothetical protein